MAKILIVDDRPANRELLVTLLGYLGHKPLEATQGEEGLEIARAEHPDLVITDIVMPNMDGYEFARQVRADPSIRHTQIIFCTSSYIVDETLSLAEACGVSVVISKPIEPEDFLKQIGEALTNPQVISSPPPSEDFHREHMRLLTDTLVRKVEELEAEILEHMRTEEQVRAQAIRLKVLADASQAFASVVQDYQVVLDQVARQVAETLGSSCAVRLLSEDGEWLEMAALYDADPEAREFARILSDQTPLRADEPHFSQRILQSERAFILPGVSEDQLRGVVKPEYWAQLRYIASQSRLLAPMRARGQVIGFLILARKPGFPAFEEPDLVLAQDLGDRAALAISNARLFKQLQNELSARKMAEEALREKNEALKSMSQQLWQTAKLATMGELAASIAHELNNPLGTVSLRTEMLMGQFSPDDAPSRSLQVIDSELKRMSTLVANLLTFSRRSTSQVSTIDLRQEVVSTLELIHYHFRKHNILIIQELSPDTPLVQADRQQLRQVFLNLFTNAADAMPQGGTLTIRTLPGEKQPPDTTARLRPRPTTSLGLPVSKMPQVLIEISDTGEGIPPEKLDQVWEPFYTTKPEGKGTGLGLAICRRIIHEHGGTIEMLSEGIPGKGVSVRITLPTRNGR